MRPAVTAFLFAVLASLYVDVSIAQDTKPSGIEKRKFKHHVEIASRYDPASDKTTVVLNPYVVQVSSNSLSPDTVSIMCGFTYRGRALTGLPDTIEFHLIFDQRRGWQFDKEKKRELSFTIDGEHVELGTMRVVGTRHYVIPGAINRYVEELYIPLTYEGIVKIASGKRVTVGVGQQQNIKLENEHLEALRDLASRMTP
jgi:hypothetical protein